MDVRELSYWSDRVLDTSRLEGDDVMSTCWKCGALEKFVATYHKQSGLDSFVGPGVALVCSMDVTHNMTDPNEIVRDLNTPDEAQEWLGRETL